MADSALGRDIAFPPLGDRQRTRLREVLGPMVALANPLDYHTFIWNDAVRMAETFAAALEGDVAMGCLIADFPRPDRCDPSAWECVIVAGARAAAEARKPLAVVATLPEALPEAVAERAIACGIIPMHGLDDTLSAIEAAAFLGQPREAPTPLLLPGDPREAVAMAEAPAKAALAGHGLSVPRMIRAGDPGALEAAAREIGLPLAIKAEGIAHKTEAGGVLLVREDLDAALGEAKAMPCGSWLVEELIEGTVAELLIGIVRDPAHGFVLTLGAGGVLAELMKDSASLLVPVTEAEIRAALDGLRIGAVLRGYRGGPAADIGAIVAAVLAVQAYVIAHAERIEEVEINPLIATREGAVAVDALIRAAP